MSGREELDKYIAELRRALDGADTATKEDIISEVRAHVEEAAGASVYDSAVREALRELGPPEAYADEMLEAAGERRSRTSGRVLGVPYDVGVPTSRKIADRMWNPADTRIFMPRVFGIGWDINFGAVAVILGLVRPDYDDVPFAGVPDAALSLAMLVPFAIEAAAVVLAATYWRLDAQVPVHFGLTGPDRFGSMQHATLTSLGPVIAVTIGVWLGVFVRRGSKGARAVSAALLTGLAMIMCPFYAAAVYYALNGTMPFSIGWAVLAGFVATFAMLVVLSRLGVRTEMNEQKRSNEGTGEAR